MKSRELDALDGHRIRSLLEVHGYKQIIALRFRIGTVVYEKVAPEQLFIVRSVGMDPGGYVVYYDNKQHPYYEDQLEEAT